MYAHAYVHVHTFRFICKFMCAAGPLHSVWMFKCVSAHWVSVWMSHPLILTRVCVCVWVHLPMTGYVYLFVCVCMCALACNLRVCVCVCPYFKCVCICQLVKMCAVPVFCAPVYVLCDFCVYFDDNEPDHKYQIWQCLIVFVTNCIRFA